MELNLFFEGVDSIGGYQSRLLQAIDDEVHFNKCICTVKAADDLDVYDEDKYIPINYDICERNRYEEYYDMNSLLPLDKEILEKMLPYESTAMKMLVRNMERDIYTYDESKRLYLNHLRFWNHMFVSHQINYVVQVCVPHHCHDYIIYALAKVYNCGLTVNVTTSIWNHSIPMTDLYKPNGQLLRKYEEYRKETKVELSDFIENYYNALLFENREQGKQLLYGGRSKKQYVALRKSNYEEYFLRENVWKRNKSHYKKLVLNGILKCNKNEILKQKQLLKYEKGLRKRARIKQAQMRSVKYYDSLAQIPDYSEKYVIFYLHYQPEATTLPLAGVFVEQELVISILAKALEKFGIRLWIKEHFLQPYRTKKFYDDINNIPNVKLIQSMVDSKDILQHSVAAATCNGTVIQESIFNGRPVMIFGNGPFIGAPGTFRCADIDSVQYAMEQILNGFTVEQHDVRAYLKAFDEYSIYTNIYPANKNRKCEISLEESMDNMRRALVSRIHDYQNDREEAE